MAKFQTNKDINLRSPGIRKILNASPRKECLWNIAIISLTAIIIAVVILFLQYPYGEGESIGQHILNSRFNH